MPRKSKKEIGVDAAEGKFVPSLKHIESGERKDLVELTIDKSPAAVVFLIATEAQMQKIGQTINEFFSK